MFTFIYIRMYKIVDKCWESLYTSESFVDEQSATNYLTERGKESADYVICEDSEVNQVLINLKRRYNPFYGIQRSHKSLEELSKEIKSLD